MTGKPSRKRDLMNKGETEALTEEERKELHKLFVAMASSESSLEPRVRPELTPQQEEYNRQVLEAKARRERREPASAAQAAWREWREQWRLDHSPPSWPAHRHLVDADGTVAPWEYHRQLSKLVQ
jgi:peptidoglycan hydrolase CwlO-like protein